MTFSENFRNVAGVEMATEIPNTMPVQCSWESIHFTSRRIPLNFDCVRWQSSEIVVHRVEGFTVHVCTVPFYTIITAIHTHAINYECGENGSSRMDSVVNGSVWLKHRASPDQDVGVVNGAAHST